MPVVSCPHCSNPVHAPPDWTRTGYTCPHCRKPVPARPSPPPDDEEEDDDFTPPPPRPTARRRPSENPVADFLTFRLMITPILIQVLFWAGTLLSVLVGLVLVAKSFDDPRGRFSALEFAYGGTVGVIGPVMVRLYCELLIIIFKIHDELKESNNRQRHRG